MKFLFAQSLNNRLIVETYKEDRGLKATVQNGFAMVQQKVSLKGLKLLVEAKVVSNGITQIIPAGSMVYFKEGALQSAPWAKGSFSCEGLDGEFMIVDAINAEFFGNVES